MPETAIALQWLASALADVGDNSGVQFWPDSSGNGYDVVPNNALLPPTWFADGGDGFPVVRVQPTKYLMPPVVPLRLGGDFTLFVVCRPHAQFGNIVEVSVPGAAGTLGAALAILPLSVRVQFDGGSVAFPTSTNQILGLWVLRRVSGVCHLRRNGVEIGSTGVFPLQVFAFGFPCSVAQSGRFAQDCGLIEVRAYADALSDESFAAIELGILQQYGLA